MKQIAIPRSTCLALLAASTISSHAAISLVASENSSGSATSTTITGFSLGAGNALAVLIASEEGGGSTSTFAAPTVTFGGTPLTSSITEAEGSQRASIFYVINPSTTSGDVVVTFADNALFAVTAVSLSDVASLGDFGTFGEPEAGMPVSVDYSGTAGGFVLASFVDNDFNNGTPTLSIAGSNINDDLTDDYFQRIDGTNASSAGRALAGAPILTDDNFSETFTEGGTSSSSRNAGVLGAFVAVPEPSVALLGGLGVLGLLRRRRTN